MSKTYKVQISELNDKVLRWAEYDPQLWLETVVKHRANAAINELYDIEFQKALKNKTAISSDKKKVVIQSNELTAEQRNSIPVVLPEESKVSND